MMERWGQRSDHRLYQAAIKYQCWGDDGRRTILLKNGGMSGRLWVCADDAAGEIFPRASDAGESGCDHRGMPEECGGE